MWSDFACGIGCVMVTLCLYRWLYYTYNKMDYAKRTITITDPQNKWVEDNTINLSRFVQKALAREMQKK